MSNPLQKDLQELVQHNVISAETADQIAHYYQSKQENAPNRFNIVLGLLGAILVGSGIVLLLAHNWELMNKTLKTIIAFLPLAIGQGLCIYTLLRKKQDRVWQESSASILFFGVAASIALVSQVYHIEGDLPGFLLVWLFLTMPVIYLLSSSIVSLLSIAGITWYACLTGYGHGSSYPWMYGLFLLYIIPHYFRLWRFYRGSSFFHWHNWLLIASWCFVLGAFSGRYYDDQWIFAAYIIYFGLLYTVGAANYNKEYTLFGNPAYFIGLIGILALGMFLSYKALWDVGGEDPRAHFHASPIAWINYACLAAISSLYFRNFKKPFDPVPVCSVIIGLLATFPPHEATFHAFMTNLCLLTIAIYFIRKGSLQNHLGILNFGLLIMVILALLRFFDGDIAFIWRGILFVSAGTGFFVANYLLLKKRKALTQNSN